MKHHTTERFRRLYDELPVPVRTLADKAFALLKSDPRHPSLRFKRVGRYWSARVGARYRALAIEEGGTFYWVWIGEHSEYERLIGRR